MDKYSLGGSVPCVNINYERASVVAHEKRRGYTGDGDLIARCYLGIYSSWNMH